VKRIAVFAQKLKVLIALLPAVVLILGAGVAYATNNDAPDTNTGGGQGGKDAGQADSKEPGETEDADRKPGDDGGPGDTEDGDGSREREDEDGPGDADEPGDDDGPGDTEDEDTSGPTTEPTNGTTIAGEPVSYEGSPGLLAPGAALLVGSGVMTYAILRRR
jgi:hypothetical protein